MTFCDFLGSLRLDAAFRLLENRDLKIQDIARMVGYSEQRYFASCFKRKFGMTPTERGRGDPTMLQFTDERLAALRAAPAGRQAGPVLDALLAATEELRTKPLIIQDAALATWGHYYACPDHAVRLVHELDRPDSFRCPVDGKRWTGEPYAGAWWRLTNGKNADGARDLSYLWLLTDDEGYRDLALRILTGYAERYPSYAVHGNITHNGPGKPTARPLRGHVHPLPRPGLGRPAGGPPIRKPPPWLSAGLFAEAGRIPANHINPSGTTTRLLVAGALGMVGILLGRDDLIDPPERGLRFWSGSWSAR
jgi:hypothetical protein